MYKSTYIAFIFLALIVAVMTTQALFNTQHKPLRSNSEASYSHCLGCVDMRGVFDDHTE